MIEFFKPPPPHVVFSQNLLMVCWLLGASAACRFWIFRKQVKWWTILVFPAILFGYGMLTVAFFGGGSYENIYLYPATMIGALVVLNWSEKTNETPE